MHLKAVIFDMDGVLTNTVEYHYLSWKQVFDEYGIPFTREDNQKLLGLSRERSLEVILGLRRISESEKQAILYKKNRYFEDFIDHMSERDLLPGVRRLLTELRQAGVKIGVASGSRNVKPVLARLGILDWVGPIADGNTIQNSKPAPDSFLAVAKAMGVEPRDCLVLEDSPSGIRAARAAGMGVIGLGPVEQVGEADAVYQNLTNVSLDDLRRIL